MTLNPSQNPSLRSPNLPNGFLSPTSTYTHHAYIPCLTHAQTSSYVCTYKECNNRLLCYECHPAHPEDHKKAVLTYKEVLGSDMLEEIEEEIGYNSSYDQKKELCMAFLTQLQNSFDEICKRIEKSIEHIFLKIKEKVLSNVADPLFQTAEWESFRRAVVEKKTLLFRANNADLPKHLNEYLGVYTKINVALSDADNLRSLSKPLDETDSIEPLSIDPAIVDEAILNLRKVINKLYTKISSQIDPMNTPAENIEKSINNSKHYKSAMAAFHLSPFYTRTTKPTNNTNNVLRSASNISISAPAQNKERSPEKTISVLLTTENHIQKQFETEECNNKKLPPFMYDEYLSSEILDLPYVGPVKLTDGSVYKGQMKDNKLYGKGKKIWKDGKVFEGYFREDNMEGKGRMIHPDQDVYEGQWHTGVAHGRGVYKRTDGWVYEGDWADDQPHGTGAEMWPDTTKYEGGYKNGLKHGKGMLKCVDGSWYKGNFRENMFDGEGTYVWADGRKYEGEWSKSVREGEGVMTWPDGRKYTGAFFEDRREGFGTFEWKNGRKYMGYWKDGKPHGQGRLSSPGEDILEGEWREGRLGQLAAITAKELKTQREKEIGKSVDLLSDLSRLSNEKNTYRGGYESPSNGRTNYSVKSIVVDGFVERKKQAPRPEMKLLLKQKSDYNEYKNMSHYPTPWMDIPKKTQGYQIQVNEKNNNR